MKKTTGIILLILLFSCMLFVFSGCNKPEDDNLTDTQNLINKFNNHASKLDNEDKEFTVEMYIQAPSLSSVDSLDIKTSDGQIYVNDILYDVVYLQDHEVIYGEGILSYASMLEDVDVDVLENIKKQKNCYMMETKAEKGYSKIAVCEMDTELYFLTFFDNGKVMRVYSTCVTGENVDLKNEGLTDAQKLINKWSIYSHDTDIQTIKFTAETFYQAGYLSALFSVDVKVKDGMIYLNDILYDTVVYTEKHDYTFNEILKWAEIENDTEVIRVLEAIKHNNACFVLKKQNEQNVADEIAIYEINGVQYFVSFYDDGEAVRVHSASFIIEE